VFVEVSSVQQVHPTATGPLATAVVDLGVQPPEAAIQQPAPALVGPLAARRGYRSAKRLLDLTLAMTLLVLLLPMACIVAVAVKLDSPGPVLFTHQRLGHGGRTIRCRKFRTMVHGDATERLGSHLDAAFSAQYKLVGDPRVTRVGRVLRRLSIDEIPQLLNVIGGSMSLIGPRPIVVDEAVTKWGELLPNLVQVKPGLSGLWQVSGRSELDYDERIRLDLEYVERCSLGLDLRILFRTVPAVLLMRGAT
jgi:exopolysaccharide production protein ExoY